MIKLGSKAKDTVSGFEGIAVARTEWLNGCARVTLQPKVGKDGKVPECMTFDEPQLLETGLGVHPKKDERGRTGGPLPIAVRQHKGPVR